MVQLLTDSSMQRALFEHVHPMLEDVTNIRSVEKNMITVKEVAIDGKYYRINRLTGGNFRYEGRPENGTLPGASSAVGDVLSPVVIDEMRFVRRQSYTGVDFSGVVANAPRSSKGGYNKLQKIIMEQTLKAYPESYSRRLAIGQSGVLGRVASADTGTGVITLVAANNPASYTAAAAAPWLGNRLIREGMVLSLTNGSANSWATALRTATADVGLLVTAVSTDGTSPTITVQSLAGSNIAAGDLLVEYKTRQDGLIDTQSEYEDGLYNPLGIMDAIQTGSDAIYSLAYYGNLAVSTNKDMQALGIENSTITPLTVDMVNRLLEQIRVDPLGTTEAADGIYLHDSAFRLFAKPFQTMTNFATNNPSRYNNPGKGFTPVVGVKTIEINNLGSEGSMKFYTSPLAPLYRAYAFRKSEMIKFVDRPFGVMNDDGLELRQQAGKDNWSVYFKEYSSGVANIIPRHSGLITGIAGDVNTVS